MVAAVLQDPLKSPAADQLEDGDRQPSMTSAKCFVSKALILMVLYCFISKTQYFEFSRLAIFSGTAGTRAELLTNYFRFSNLC